MKPVAFPDASPDRLDTASGQIETATRQPGKLPYYTSASLFHGSKEVIIVHAQREYRLRITASGKLILTA